MTGKDEYYNRAKQEGYRARSAYKLIQLDEAAGLIGPDDAVLDLGAAPGGWLQVARERTDGPVVGVDRQRIDPIDGVETIRGDVTEEGTKTAIRERLRGGDGESGDRGDHDESGDAPGADRPVDVVLSDMAPNMTGEYSVDHARSVHLARQAFDVALDLLAPGGDFVTKVFDGPDLAALREEMEADFEYVRSVRPDASRDSSSELYLVAKGYTTAPVESGDELTVEITDEGREGDGIARVDGFTVFVPDGDVGEEVEIRIDDVNPRFAFAERR